MLYLFIELFIFFFVCFLVKGYKWNIRSILHRNAVFSSSRTFLVWSLFPVLVSNVICIYLFMNFVYICNHVYKQAVNVLFCQTLRYLPEISIKSMYLLLELTRFLYMVVDPPDPPLLFRFSLFVLLLVAVSSCLCTHVNKWSWCGWRSLVPVLFFSPYTRFNFAHFSYIWIKDIKRSCLLLCMFKSFKRWLTSHRESPRGLHFTHTVLCYAGEGSFVSC